MNAPQTLAAGRYLLVKRLGEGGMATVWRAFDQRLQVWRAIKILLPEYATKKKIMARFEAEAQTMALLEHPNIVRVYDVDRDGNHAYIVMELIEGGSLVDWLEAYGPMPPRMAVDVIVAVSQALQFAHDKGVIHRDIKPHNIMVDRDGVCRLTDFGIARAGDTDDHLTKTGAVMGTWGYMAPEQRTDAKHVDARADVYALAATLYSLLTDKTPTDLFAADRDASLTEGVPEALLPILLKATEYKKERRHQTVSEFAADLVAVRDQLPETPPGTPPLRRDLEALPPPPRLEPTQPDRAANPTAMTILPGDDAESVTGSYTMPPVEDGLEITGQHRPVWAPAPERGRSPVGLLAGGAVLLLLVGGGAAAYLLRSPEAPAPAPAPLASDPPTEAAVETPAAEPSPVEAASEPAKPAPAAPPRPAKPASPTPADERVAGTTPPADPPSTTDGGSAEPPPVEPTPAVQVKARPPEQCFRDVKVTVQKETVGIRASTCLGEGTPVVLMWRPAGSTSWFPREMKLLLGAHAATIDLGDGIEWYLQSAGVTYGSASAPKRTTPGDL